MEKMKKYKKIQRVSERGQITLPKKWREYYPSDSVELELQDSGELIIRPIIPLAANEESLWNAVRDNNGEGIAMEDFAEALRKHIEDENK